MTGATYPELPAEQFEQIPFIEEVPKDGRTVFLLPYYDVEEDDWYLYLPVRPGELGRIGGGESVTGAYFSTSEAAASDVFFPLGTLVTQYISFPGVVGAWQELLHPVFQLCCVLEKYELFAKHKPEAPLSVSHLASAELEYLLVVVRSIYDLVQKLAKHAASYVVNPEDLETKLMQDLPGTFSQVVLHGDRLRKSEEIQETWGVLEPIADFYAAEAPHFALIRSLRDDFVHHGRGLQGIFEVDGGLGVSVESDPWKELPVWDREGWVRNERFGSLRGVLYYLASDALEMTTRYAEAFVSCVGVRPAVVPGCRVFLRHPFSGRLAAANEVMNNPWEEEVGADNGA